MNDHQDVRLQFLDEAVDYLSTIESGLLDLGQQAGKDPGIIDGILRAAHSIKGGAAMMGYSTLSDLAHRFEDFFKVLKGDANRLGSAEERLLLQGVDFLRACVASYQRGIETVEPDWLEQTVMPLVADLHARLGDPVEESLLATDSGEDMVTLLFQTEVESCLARLEGILAQPNQPCLQEEFLIAAQELGGLGEMLSLSPFVALCQSVQTELSQGDRPAATIAETALATWRRSQALVMIGQRESLPRDLEWEESGSIDSTPPSLELMPVDFDLAELTALTVEETESVSPAPAAVSPALDALDTIPDFQKIGPDALAMLGSLAPMASNGNSQPQGGSPVAPAPQPATPVPLTPAAPAEIPATGEPLSTAASSSPETAESTIRVAVHQLDTLGDLLGELTIERNGLGLQLQNLRELLQLLVQRVKILDKSNRALRQSYDRGGLGALEITAISDSSASLTAAALLPTVNTLGAYFDHLEMDRYSGLHLVFQELMESIVQIQEVTNDLDVSLEGAQKTSRELTLTSQLLQGQLTKVRMRPLSDVVGRFPRALRDMCLRYGKQAELKIVGGSTQIDRTVLSALNEPLLHLLRNAFDHGLEDPAIRMAAGKPAQGLIEISAMHRGNQTIITLRDDGQGINLDRIRAKALKMGLTEKDLDAASKRDLLNLIFEPGFSTAEQVTDISGRGVGMDIVRTNLQQVRGQIQVDTRPGQGTTFTITVPFTLSVVRVLLVESAGLPLAFPTTAIEEMLPLTSDTLLKSAGQEFINWEGQMIPLIRLPQWFQFSRVRRQTELSGTPLINMPMVLLIDQGHGCVGLEVDRYWGEQEVTIRAVEGPLSLPEGFSGCTIAGDGRVVPMVDPFALLRWIEQNRYGPAETSLASGERDEFANFNEATTLRPLVLVVDDSVTVRRFLAMTLEKAGYRVEQAKDGQDALEKLAAGSSPAAVISDIEMPRLDGYGFLAHVRSKPELKRLPIVMLTSRSGDKHRQLAMNLGARAYFSKPFQETALLNTLHSLIHAPTAAVKS
jgi:chemosensory pili system protein ChpA (sensor histidine kinase/response regulator)